MSVMIKGVRITQISATRKDGVNKFNGTYELVSNTDFVLATQNFGEDAYQALKYSLSAKASAALNTLMSIVKEDINAMIGVPPESPTP